MVKSLVGFPHFIPEWTRVAIPSFQARTPLCQAVPLLYIVYMGKAHMAKPVLPGRRLVPAPSGSIMTAQHVEISSEMHREIDSVPSLKVEFCH